MTNPLVSIIIPAYNSGKYIGECLQSVINQTYKNWECFIVLAPSTDNTLDEIWKFINIDEPNPKIRIIREDIKSNCATARNKGFDECNGKYVTFLDADDWWESTKLSVMVNHMEMFFDPGTKWSAHYVDIHYANGNIIHEQLYPGHHNEVGGIGNVIFRKEYLNDIKKRWGYIFYEKMDRADDGDLVLRIRNDLSRLVPVMLSHYRWNEEGLSANTTGIHQSKIMICAAIRNKSYDILPIHLKNLAVCVANEITGIDWVKLKKETFR